MYELRDYQQEAVDVGVDYLSGKSRTGALLVEPVGCGKSIIIGGIAKALKKPLLVIQPSRELTLQNHEKAVSLGMSPTIFSASCNSKELSPLTYATLKSVKKVVDELKSYGVKHVIIDEADMNIPNISVDNPSEWQIFQEAMGFKKVLGLTASPVKIQQYSHLSGDSYSQLNMLNRIHGKTFSKIIHVLQNREIIQKGFWSPLQYEKWDFDSDVLMVNNVGSEYTEDSIKKYVTEHKINNLITARIIKLAESKKSILVFMDSVDSCKVLCNYLNSNRGIPSVVVDAKMPDKARTKAVSGFKSGEIKVALCYATLGVGFDHPSLDTIVMGRPTFSVRTWYQYCLDMKTEILTKRGFLKYNEIKEHDIVAAYKDGEIIWTDIREVIYRRIYDGEKMIEYKNQHLDIRVTDSHDMLVKQNGCKSYKKMKASEMYNINYAFHIPVSGVEKIQKNNLRDCDVLFLGYFLSDGYLCKSNNQIVIAQSLQNERIVNEIEKVIIQCGMRYGKIILKRKGEMSKYKDLVHFKISKGMPKDKKDNRKGWAYLMDYIDKNMTEAYERLDEDQFDLLLWAINEGDGNKGKCKWVRRSYTICMGNHALYANRLQSLAIRRGYRCNLYSHNKNGGEHYVIHAKKQQHSSIAGQKSSETNIKKKYNNHRPRVKEFIPSKDEYVWCISNDIGTIITRRNGKVAIMGNCGRLVRKDPNNPDKVGLVVDCCGNYDRFGPVEDLSIEEFGGYGWGMFSKNRLLTGIPMGTYMDKQMLAETYGMDPSWKARQSYNKNTQRCSIYGEYILEDGSYKGHKIKDVPVEYLEFLVKCMPANKLNINISKHLIERSNKL